MRTSQQNEISKSYFHGRGIKQVSVNSSFFENVQILTLVLFEAYQHMNFYLSRSLIFAFFVFSNIAFANGAAALLIQNQHNQSLNQESSLMTPTFRTDGFVIARNFYHDGPVIRICQEVAGKTIVALNDSCAFKVSKKAPFFSLSWNGMEYSYTPTGPGVTLQEYLDLRFGQNKVTHVSVVPRTSHYREQLYIFYTINQ